VRAFEKRADRPSDDRYGMSIRVKVNIDSVLRMELRRSSWKREEVVVGAATDPYQPAEGTYRLTRRCLEALTDAHNPFGIITRGPLIVRDIDVLREGAKRGGVNVHVSIPTLDLEVWKHTEPGAPPPRQRLRAVRMLVDAGINAGIGIAPVLPGISDRPEQLEEIVKAAREAGATNVWANVVYLRPGTREHFFECLSRHWPEELARYQRQYLKAAYPGREITEPVKRTVAELRKRYQIADRRRIRLVPEARSEQLELAV
jgi:DNA repair photolyase